MPADFCQIFDDRLNDLYTLALLLTVVWTSAEQCLVPQVWKIVLPGNPVFREWAHSWVKRSVVKNVTKLKSPKKSKIKKNSPSPKKACGDVSQGAPDPRSERYPGRGHNPAASLRPVLRCVVGAGEILRPRVFNAGWGASSRKSSRREYGRSLG